MNYLKSCAYGTTAGEDSADMLPIEDTVGETANTQLRFLPNLGIFLAT